MKSILSFGLVFLILGFSSDKGTKTPPGTVKITDYLYFDKTEVTNFSWKEFEYSVSLKYGKGSPEHLAVLPEYKVWLEGAFQRPDLVSSYYQDIKYRDYPVVGISHEQALAFCKWRTSMVKMFYAKKYHSDFQIEYKLPSQEQWEMVAYWESGRITNFRKGTPERCHLMPDTVPFKNENLGPLPVTSLSEGLFGLHHLIGNVAEMLDEKNACKGGSWQHFAEESRVGKAQTYTGPNKWLGFRCVCVVNTSSK